MSLKSFLFTSVRNRALNSITRSHITRQVYEEYQSQQLKSLPALDSCYGTELFNTYMEALHSLPKELQRVYVMSRYKQLTHKEIADKLEVSVQDVYKRQPVFRVIYNGWRGSLVPLIIVTRLALNPQSPQLNISHISFSRLLSIRISLLTFAKVF